MKIPFGSCVLLMANSAGNRSEHKRTAPEEAASRARAPARERGAGFRPLNMVLST